MPHRFSQIRVLPVMGKLCDIRLGACPIDACVEDSIRAASGSKHLARGMSHAGYKPHALVPARRPHPRPALGGEFVARLILRADAAAEETPFTSKAVAVVRPVNSNLRHKTQVIGSKER
jgi:hypothetical protein